MPPPRRSPPQQLCRCVLLAILLSATVTLTLLYSTKPFDNASRAEDQTQQLAWPMSVPNWWPDSPQHQATALGFGWDMTNSWLEHETDETRINAASWANPAGPDHFETWRIRHGWPFLVVRRVKGYGRTSERGAHLFPSTTSDDLPGHLNIPGAGTYAASPHYTGLALNTAFYALIPYALLRALTLLRRHRRRRAGRCRACGYDLAGIGDKCPECGGP